MSSSEVSPNPTNELAKERTRAAAERTLSSWINNCLVLIGFGVTINQFFPGLIQLLAYKPDRTITQLAHFVGLCFIGLSIGLLLIVMVQHLFILQWLKQPAKQFKTATFLKLNQLSIAAVLLFGALSLIMIFSKSS